MKFKGMENRKGIEWIHRKAFQDDVDTDRETFVLN